jgi:hypothetical protein
VLEKHYTGKACSLANDFCQYELKKAIVLCRGATKIGALKRRHRRLGLAQTTMNRSPVQAPGIVRLDVIGLVVPCIPVGAPLQVEQLNPAELDRMAFPLKYNVACRERMIAEEISP